MPASDHRGRPIHSGHLNERNFATYTALSRGNVAGSKEDLFHVPAGSTLPEGFDEMHPDDKYNALNEGGFWSKGWFNVPEKEWDEAEQAGHETNELAVRAEEY